MSEDKLYYKATDRNIQCRGYQFELGEWSDPVEGDLELCEHGYHFCEQPSGVWAYYDGPTTRVFKCRVKDAIMGTGPGADVKSVCRQVMLVEEVAVDGNRNTGDYNTGYRNTGDYNTGDCNTGDRNTGYCNTGDYNTGYRNTGDRNTGYRNTGYGNTGDYNIGDFHTGMFGTGEAPFFSFGEPANRAGFNWSLARQFYDCVQTGEGWDDPKFLAIPNATPRRIEEYVKAFNNATKGR